MYIYLCIHIKEKEHVLAFISKDAAFLIQIHFYFIVSLYALRLPQFIVLSSTRYCNKQKYC